MLANGSETIAVVVVTYNSVRYIPDLIESLEPGLRGVRWHLTVADNASAANTVDDMLNQKAPILIKHNPLLLLIVHLLLFRMLNPIVITGTLY